jgi:hypothetical protein
LSPHQLHQPCWPRNPTASFCHVQATERRLACCTTATNKHHELQACLHLLECDCSGLLLLHMHSSRNHCTCLQQLPPQGRACTADTQSSVCHHACQDLYTRMICSHTPSLRTPRMSGCRQCNGAQASHPAAAPHHMRCSVPPLLAVPAPIIPPLPLPAVAAPVTTVALPAALPAALPLPPATSLAAAVPAISTAAAVQVLQPRQRCCLACCPVAAIGSALAGAAKLVKPAVQCSAAWRCVCERVCACVCVRVAGRIQYHKKACIIATTPDGNSCHHMQHLFRPQLSAAAPASRHQPAGAHSSSSPAARRLLRASSTSRSSSSLKPPPWPSRRTTSPPGLPMPHWLHLLRRAQLVLPGGEQGGSQVLGLG